MALGDNAKSVFTNSIRGTARVYLPSAANDAGVVAYDCRDRRQVMAKVVSTLDQAATLQLEGTTFDDATFVEGDVEVANVAIAAGNVNAQIQSLLTKSGWAYVRISAICAVAPTVGQLKVVFTSIERRE